MSKFDQEAEALLCYLLGKKPSQTLLQRHITAVKISDDDKPIGLHGLALSWPPLLRFFDPPFGARGPRQTRFRKRLNVGLTLCETSPEGVHRLRQTAGESRMAIIAGLFGALAIDALTMPIRLVIWRIW